MSGGPPRGVWGQRVVTPTASFSTEWLITRMNKVGLDGSICAEYISSLIELHKSSSSGERDAAIAEFLHDSIPSSSLRSIADQNRFVDETLGDIRQRLAGPAPSPVPPVAAKSKGSVFKKGTKLSGTALKELVGNVKPSYIQQYSDDEKNPPPPPPPAAPPAPTRFVSDPQETPVRQVSVSTRRRNKAKEIGPDEDWEEPVSGVATPWRTPFESRSPMSAVGKFYDVQVSSPEAFSARSSPKRMVPTPPPPKPVKPPTLTSIVEKLAPLQPAETPLAETTQQENSSSEQVVDEPRPLPEPLRVDVSPPKEETSVEAAPKSVLLSPQSLLYSLPTDILSFDFQFEDEEEEQADDSAVSMHAAPFDLLKQMFSTSQDSTAAPSFVENLPPPGFLDNSKIYTVPFLLSVLKEMKARGDIPIPDELRGLCKAEISVSPAKPRSDSFGWRTHGQEKNATESNQGSWRASGYNHKNGPRRPQQPAQEEGFW